MLNLHGWPLWHWHFEISSICTLKCPRCPRTELPDSLVQDQLRLDFFRANFDRNMLRNVRRVTLCGDDGDPIYARDFLPIVHHFKSNDPTISLQIITNGGYKDEDWWRELGSMLNHYDEVHFSIDGSTQSISEQYRINSDHASSILGMKTLADSSYAFISWDMIAFKFNEHDIDDCHDLARAYGCDQFQLTLSSKFGSKYPGYLEDGKDALEPSDVFLPKGFRFERRITNLTGRTVPDNGAIAANIAAYERIKESSSSIIPLCKIGTKGMFVNSRGYLIPCCWVGNRYNWSGYSRFIRDDNNIKIRGLESVLNADHWLGFFEDFYHMRECGDKCSASLVNEQYATKW